MISCDECQRKMVAFFDNEGAEGDEALISGHLRECTECRAFQKDMVRIRGEFASVAVPTLPVSVCEEVFRRIPAERPERKESLDERKAKRDPLRGWLRGLSWAWGLVGLFLVMMSLLGCLILARKVVELRRELRLAKLGAQILPETKSVSGGEETVGRVLSVRETCERLRELVRVGDYYGIGEPLRVSAVPTNLRFPGGASPEKMAVLAGYWKDRTRLYVEQKIVVLKEFQKIANPAFERIVESYVRALEAYRDGRIHDSIELIEMAERLWEATGGGNEQRFPGRVLAPGLERCDAVACRGYVAAAAGC